MVVPSYPISNCTGIMYIHNFGNRKFAHFIYQTKYKWRKRKTCSWLVGEVTWCCTLYSAYMWVMKKSKLSEWKEKKTSPNAGNAVTHIAANNRKINIPQAKGATEVAEQRFLVSNKLLLTRCIASKTSIISTKVTEKGKWYSIPRKAVTIM